MLRLVHRPAETYPYWIEHYELGLWLVKTMRSDLSSAEKAFTEAVNKEKLKESLVNILRRWEKPRKPKKVRSPEFKAAVWTLPVAAGLAGVIYGLVLFPAVMPVLLCLLGVGAFLFVIFMMLSMYFY